MQNAIAGGVITDRLLTQGSDPGKIRLFEVVFGKEQRLSFRYFEPARDLPTVYEWVHADHAREFWDMAMPMDALRAHYEELLTRPYFSSLIGTLNDKPVCQMDVYDPRFDDVGLFVNAKSGDLGLHLLLGERKNTCPALSYHIVTSFCSWYFSMPGCLRIVAEPDARNKAAIWLLRQIGFDCLGYFDLPAKRAACFMMDREKFSILFPEAPYSFSYANQP